MDVNLKCFRWHEKPIIFEEWLSTTKILFRVMELKIMSRVNKNLYICHKIRIYKERVVLNRVDHTKMNTNQLALRIELLLNTKTSHTYYLHIYLFEYV